MDEGLVQAIRALYENSSSAVLLNIRLGEFFKTIIGVRQGCLLLPIPLSLFLEKIMLMQETLHDHQTSISVGVRCICNLRFADDVDLMGGSSNELQDPTYRLVDRAPAYGMEVSVKKSKIITNSTNNISADNSMNGQMLADVTSFKHWE